MCLLLVCLKGKLLLLLDKNVYVSQETRLKFIKSKFLLSLSLQVVLYQSGAFIWYSVTNMPSIMAHRRYMYRLLNVRRILEKVVSMQHSFEEILKNKEDLNWSLLEIL